MTAESRPPTFLIADVAVLTGVPPSRLRSWERAGLLHPGRASGAVRVYGVEDVARVRLIERSLVNPGRRGSLRRLAARLASGELRPAPQDYAESDVPPALGTAASPQSDRPGSPEAVAGVGWRDIVEAMADPVAVCDGDGALVYANPTLRTALRQEGKQEQPADTFFASGDLSLRWTARTGVPQRDVPVVLHRPDGTECHTLWHAAPLRGIDGALRGAVGVGRDVTAERALARAHQDWPAAAGDLRAPLTTILGHLQLARRILDGAVGRATASPAGSPPSRLARHLEMAEIGAHELLRSMETLLDASAAAAGGLVRRLDPDDVDLGELAQRAVDHARALTTRHAITLERSREPLVVAGDRARLRQVLDNLLANAVKYAPDGGPIDVRLEAAATPPLAPTPTPSGPGDAPSWALLRVADAGLGIPAADVRHVFDRHRRAAGAARLVRGTGLGLYACRAIVAAHGGHVWVERTAVPTTSVGGADRNEHRNGGWHGTVMAVALPLRSPPGPAAVGAEGDTGGPAGAEEGR